MSVRVTVWNEYIQERDGKNPVIAQIYPDGIHAVLRDFLEEAGYDVTTATLDMPEHGLTEEVLARTDVLVWWGHVAHGAVSDEVVDRVHRRVLSGMGLIVLHSGHASRIFNRLIGTDTKGIRWRECCEKEILWAVKPGHPILEGLEDEKIIIEESETFGEPFPIPDPDELLFISWYSGGDVFRSGFTYTRGLGRIFYFKPGHETHPIYYMPAIQRVIVNACKWAAPVPSFTPTTGLVPPVV